MPPVCPGHQEHEVEADVHQRRRVGAGPARAGRRARASRTRARPAPARRRAIRARSAGSPQEPQRRVGERARLVGDEQVASRLEVREPLPAERRRDDGAAGRHRLDDLHADPRAGEDRARRRRARARRTAPSRARSRGPATPSRPSSARDRLGRVLADDVEPRVGQRGAHERPDLGGEPADALVVGRVAHRAGEQQPRRRRRRLGRGPQQLACRRRSGSAPRASARARAPRRPRRSRPRPPCGSGAARRDTWRR